jgi:hypothetical protein
MSILFLFKRSGHDSPGSHRIIIQRKDIAPSPVRVWNGSTKSNLSILLELREREERQDRARVLISASKDLRSSIRLGRGRISREANNSIDHLLYFSNLTVATGIVVGLNRNRILGGQIFNAYFSRRARKRLMQVSNGPMEPRTTEQSLFSFLFLVLSKKSQNGECIVLIDGFSLLLTSNCESTELHKTRHTCMEVVSPS